MPVKKPFFSIIIPTLNEETALPKLIADIAKQSFIDFETIVVDGNSQDNTQNIIKNSADIKLIVSPIKGVALQRNLGAASALGHYLLFFDADISIPPYFLEGIKYKTSVFNPDVFTCWLNQQDVPSENRIVVNFINTALEIGKSFDSPFANGSMIGCKKSVYLKTKGFNPKITYGEDSELVRRLNKQGFNFMIFKDPQYIYSLRRFKKEGTLTMVRKVANLNLGILFNGFPEKNVDNLYPMNGGQFYKTRKKTTHIIKLLEETFKKIPQSPPNKGLQKFLRSIFTD